MVKVKDLNPTPIGRIGGGDLAVPFKGPDNHIGFLWGDSWDGNTPALGSGPDWRSPVITWSPTTDMSQPIVFDSAVKNGAQLWDYQHNNPEFSTVLPCDAIMVGDRIYIWVMVTKGLGNEIRCEIAYSDDRGATWQADGNTHFFPNGDPKWSTSFNGGKRTMITWEKGGDGFIYIIGTGGLARDKNACMWRVPENHSAIVDPYQWQAWQFVNGAWQWGPGEATDILPAGTKLGEISLRKIQNHWVFSGFDAGNYRAFVKVGYGPIENINWHTAPTTYPVVGVGIPFLQDVVPQLYGCYVHPSSRFDGSFVMIVSTWNTATGNPYRAMQYRIKTPAKLGPL